MAVYMTDEDLRSQALEFIEMAKDAGASSVVFRRDHRRFDPDARPSALERVFEDHKLLKTSRCKSCRVWLKLIRGVSVNFKASAYEPTQHHPEEELYELVFHSNGQLCRDWSRRQQVNRPFPPFKWNPEAHAWQQQTASRGVDTTLDECSDKVQSTTEGRAAGAFVLDDRCHLSTLGDVSTETSCRIMALISTWSHHTEKRFLESEQFSLRQVERLALEIARQLPEADTSRTRDVIQFDLEHKSIALCLLVSYEAIEVRHEVTEWSGPHSPMRSTLLWKRVETAQFDPHKLSGLLDAAVRARLDSFVVCRFCQESHPPEHCVERACHRCASNELGIVF